MDSMLEKAAPSKADYAASLVRLNGFDPRSAAGQRRINAILVAAEHCETYAQFTRAAQFAVSDDFDTVVYDKDLLPRGRAVLAASHVAGMVAFAAAAAPVLADLADDGWFELFHSTARFVTG